MEMIKVDTLDVEKVSLDGTRIVKASLLADTKDEVITAGTDVTKIEGLDVSDVLSMGSTAFTTDAELGVLDSTGMWKF